MKRELTLKNGNELIKNKFNNICIEPNNMQILGNREKQKINKSYTRLNYKVRG